MTTFILISAFILFSALVLNFGFFFFKKIFPFFLGGNMLWDKQNDRLKLLIGIATVYLSFFAFRSIWIAINTLEVLNGAHYILLLVSNVLFYVIYTKNKMLFQTFAQIKDSNEKKNHDIEIKLKIEETSFDEKIVKYQEGILKTIAFINEQRNKQINQEVENLKDDMDKSLDTDFFANLKLEELQKIYRGFRQEEIIEKYLSFEEFTTELKNKNLKVKMQGPSLYYFHKELKNHFKITLKEFIGYFNRKDGSPFKYVTVKNGSSQPYPVHKELFEKMFV
ncbi:hypothetical protein [Myroides sp. LJL119]